MQTTIRMCNAFVAHSRHYAMYRTRTGVRAPTYQKYTYTYTFCIPHRTQFGADTRKRDEKKASKQANRQHRAKSPQPENVLCEHCAHIHNANITTIKSNKTIVARYIILSLFVSSLGKNTRLYSLCRICARCAKRIHSIHVRARNGYIIHSTRCSVFGVHTQTLPTSSNAHFYVEYIMCLQMISNRPKTEDRGPRTEDRGPNDDDNDNANDNSDDKQRHSAQIRWTSHNCNTYTT